MDSFQLYYEPLDGDMKVTYKKPPKSVALLKKVYNSKHKP